MKTRKIQALLCAILLALSLYSCKKSDSAVAEQKTNYLTSAPWKNVSTEWQTTTGSWVAPPSWASATYPAMITFLDTYTYTSTSGATGTWQYSTDKSQVILTRNSVSLTATIDVLNGTSLQLSRPMDPNTTYTIEGSGTNAKYTYYNKERTNFTH